MHDLVRLHYPTVERMRLVQDNLTIPTPGSVYQLLPPEEALQVARQFALHYTPKKGSWLNMAEIECAALATQCLHRSIADQDTVEQQ
jgi:hypothetical protein